MVLADRPTTSRWTPRKANAPIRSGRSSKARTEADTSSARHPRRSQSHSESDLGSAFDPTRAVTHAGTKIQHRDRIRLPARTQWASTSATLRRSGCVRTAARARVRPDELVDAAVADAFENPGGPGSAAVPRCLESSCCFGVLAVVGTERPQHVPADWLAGSVSVRVGSHADRGVPVMIRPAFAHHRAAEQHCRRRGAPLGFKSGGVVLAAAAAERVFPYPAPGISVADAR